MVSPHNAAPLNVAYITDAIGLGGGETSLLYLLRACQKDGRINPILICPEGQLAQAGRTAGVKTCNVEITALRRQPWSRLSTYLRQTSSLARILLKEHVRHIHTELVPTLCHTVPFLLLPAYRVFHTYHGFGAIHNKAVAALMRWRLHKVFAVSEAAMQGAKALVAASKIIRLPLALGPEFLEDHERAPVVGLPQGKRIILQLARFQKIKGQDRLLRAYVYGRDHGKFDGSILLFVGGVLPGSDAQAHEFYESVRQQAQSCKYSADIHFWDYQSHVIPLLRQTAVLVIPSAYETFGMVAIEAMAVGTPVIATMSGGPAEIIQNEETGLVCDCSDERELALKIERILAGGIAVERMTLKAITTAREIYAPEKRVEALYHNYIR